MSKTKEFNMLADKATKEAMDAIYNICDWTLTGDDADQLLGSTLDINEAHSYMMKLVISNLSRYNEEQISVEQEIKDKQ